MVVLSAVCLSFNLRWSVSTTRLNSFQISALPGSAAALTSTVVYASVAATLNSALQVKCSLSLLTVALVWGGVVCMIGSSLLSILDIVRPWF